jgi:cyclophilin family peptidyl-prolyl cis-trans isomerase
VKRNKLSNAIAILAFHQLLFLPFTAYGQPGTEKAVPPRLPVAVIETSRGSFEVELLENDAPRTVENFVRLAEKKFFDGTHIHRVSRAAGLIQMGDDRSRDTSKVKEWGSGGRSVWGREFSDEIDLRKQLYKEGYKKGVVAMANHGPNTNSSQFFVMFRDADFMPKNYTIFGKVAKGIEVIEKFAGSEIVPVLGLEDGRPRPLITAGSLTQSFLVGVPPVWRRRFPY